MDNYLLSRDRAQAYFLRFDQEKLIRSWNLKYDAAYLYVDYFGRPYRICRKSGKVTRLWEEKEAGYEEVLSIFDLLCHQGEGKYLAGRYAPVNSLKGRPPTAGVDTNFYSSVAECFDKDPEAFRATCLAIGGRPAAMGDIGFQFPVFGDMTVILKFYHSDEDFPASVTLLWDDNTLQYIFYETVFYIAGFLLGTIKEAMQQYS